ncbi:MAG: hypothetical protein HOV81_01615 [Kofleriaceae bacterium]|nr:hypothetical protein [Kofleriaceae bacterium]
MRSLLSLALVLAACGTDSVTRDDDDDPIVEPDVCDTSYLDYDNFGAPFVINWCRGCHSSSVPQAMRQRAPLGVNFDTADDVRTWGAKIAEKTTGMTPTMPPAGGPSADERALLAEWLTCGAR